MRLASRSAFVLVLPLATASVVVAACSSSVSTGTGASGTGATSSSSGHGGQSTSSSSSGVANTSGTSSTSSAGTGGDAGPSDAPFDIPIVPPPDGSIMNPCALPGSVVFTSNGTTIVPGGSPSWPSLSFLHLPPGFCAHYYGTVGNARQLRFAPGGELFVSSPTMVSTGGGPNGESAFIILPDDNQDGVGDAPVTFLSFASSGAMNQGMLFAPGYFYYQDGVTGTQILRMPYVTGQRAPSAAGEMVANINVYTSALHWPKTMDMADDGSIYVGNGGDQGESCDLSRPFHGGILKLDPAPGGPNPGGQQIAKGLRNPIAVRCRPGKDTCFALELALDYSSGQGGREKLLPIHQGDDWGFPCCATQNLAYQTGNNPATNADCATTAAEGNSFLIGDTPFGVDFEGGHWPAPYTDNAFVVTHGAAGSWTGARLVAIPVDPSTGLPTPSTDADGGKNVGMTDFGTGWDDGTLTHGRPAAVAFHPDGRLFVANDNNGVIFWIGSTN